MSLLLLFSLIALYTVIRARAKTKKNTRGRIVLSKTRRGRGVTFRARGFGRRRSRYGGQTVNAALLRVSFGRGIGSRADTVNRVSSSSTDDNRKRVVKRTHREPARPTLMIKYQKIVSAVSDTVTVLAINKNPVDIASFGLYRSIRLFPLPLPCNSSRGYL